MAKGPLRLAIEDFIQTSPPSVAFFSYKTGFNHRLQEITDLVNEVLPLADLHSFVFATYALGLGTLYIFTGFRPFFDILTAIAHPPAPEDAIAKVMQYVTKLEHNSGYDDFVTGIGAITYEGLKAKVDGMTADDLDNPDRIISELYGLCTTTNLAMGLTSWAAELATGGLDKAFGMMIQDILHTTGVSRLSHHLTLGMLNNSVLPIIDHYYALKYRPQRFTASEVRDLYALGRITPEQVRAEAAGIGWRDEDIAQWIALAFKPVGEADIWQAWHEGKIDMTEVAVRLRALGYDPDDIPLLFTLNPMPPEAELKSTSASTLRTAYRDGLISANDLNAGLEVLNYNPDERALVKSIEDITKANAAKTLTVSEIKSAWTVNVIGDQEARHYLGLEGFESDQIDLLLDTWKKEIVPTFRLVNLSTIVGAYVTHIFNRQQAHDKLTGIGFSDDDATLELDLAELRNPDAFNPPPAPPQKLLTPGVLSELVFYGLMTQPQMHDRLVALNYSDADATLLAQAAAIRAQPKPTPLPSGTIDNAYRSGVIDRTAAVLFYEQLGYTEVNANLTVDTIEAKYPADFGAPPEVRIKTLSEATLIALDVNGIITDAELTARLQALNYLPSDITLVINRVAQMKAPPVKVLTEATVLQAYLVGVLTRDQVIARLVEMKFTAADAETTVTTFEQSNPAVFNPQLVQVVRSPSITALVTAALNTLITEAEYYARAAELGYTPDDAALFLALATRNPRKSTTQLSVSNITSAYGAGFYSFGQAQTLLATRGYSDEDSTILLRLSKDVIQDTTTWYALLGGKLDFPSALTALVNAKYNDKDIVAAFGTLPAATLTALGVNLQDLASFLAQFPGGQ